MSVPPGTCHDDVRHILRIADKHISDQGRRPAVVPPVYDL
jgi:hypothetical protein